MSEFDELQSEYIKYCNQKYEMKANFLFESGFKNSLELDMVQFLLERLNTKQSEIDQLKAEKAGFQNLVKSLRSEFDLNGGSEQVERQIELLEEAVRGQAKQQQPKLGKTAIGDCLHFGTTMFHDGKATCFDCDAVVNHERKVIGVMEVKALRGGHE